MWQAAAFCVLVRLSVVGVVIVAELRLLAVPLSLSLTLHFPIKHTIFLVLQFH